MTLRIAGAAGRRKVDGLDDFIRNVVVDHVASAVDREQDCARHRLGQTLGVTRVPDCRRRALSEVGLERAGFAGDRVAD